MRLVSRTSCPQCFGNAGLVRNVPSATRAKRRWYSNGPHDQIDESSLQATLDLHRAKNRSLLIKYVPGPDRPRRTSVFRPQLPRENLKTPPEKAPEYPPPQKPPVRRVAGGSGRVVRQIPALPRDGDRKLAAHLHWNIQKRLQSVVRHAKENQMYTFLRKRGGLGNIFHSEDPGQQVQCPWLDYVYQTDTDGLSRLDAEMKAFMSYMSRISEEGSVARVVSNDARAVLTAAGLPAPIPCGSIRSGMAMRHSDVTLFVWVKNRDSKRPDIFPNKSLLSYFRQSRISDVRKALSASPRFILPDGADIIGRHPICANHVPSGLSLRIQCGTNFRDNETDHIIEKYQAEFPTLRNLYIVIRMMLETRGLCFPISANDGSYELLMIIVAALKSGELTFKRDDLSQQLLHVLKFYKNLNLLEDGVSVDAPHVFSRAEILRSSSIEVGESPQLRGLKSICKRAGQYRDPLILQDPAHYMKNLGSSCYPMDEIQIAFKEIYNDLISAVRAWDGESTSTDEQGDNGTSESASETAKLIMQNAAEGKKNRTSILHFALGANYEDLESLRDKVLMFYNKMESRRKREQMSQQEMNAAKREEVRVEAEEDISKELEDFEKELQ